MRFSWSFAVRRRPKRQQGTSEANAVSTNWEAMEKKKKIQKNKRKA